MDDKHWPHWSAQKGASITYDGLPLDEILRRIHSQIDHLKSRQYSIISNDDVGIGDESESSLSRFQSIHYQMMSLDSRLGKLETKYVDCENVLSEFGQQEFLVDDITSKPSTRPPSAAVSRPASRPVSAPKSRPPSASANKRASRPSSGRSVASERETHVSREMIRPIVGDVTMQPNEKEEIVQYDELKKQQWHDDRIVVGMKVEVNYDGRGDWHTGTVTKDHGNDTYDVTYGNRSENDFEQADDGTSHKKLQFSLEEMVNNILQSTANSLTKVDEDSTLRSMELENRIKALEIAMETDVQRRLAQNTDSEKRLELEVQSLKALVDVKFKAIDDKFSLLGDRYDQKFAKVDQNISTIFAKVSKLEVSLDSLLDQEAVAAHRIIEFEQKFSLLTSSLEGLKSTIKSMAENVVPRILQDLQILDETKVHRQDLESKADLIMALGKADMSEVERLDEVIEQLGRRVGIHSREAAENLAQVQRNAEKKMDAIMNWCTAHIRKEPAAPRPGENADIGKIKCLVCDQVVKQHVEQDVVFGGPGLRSTMKMFRGGPKRQNGAESRGSSPPPNYHGGDRDVSPMAPSPTVVSSKLARLTALVAGATGPGEQFDEEEYLSATAPTGLGGGSGAAGGARPSTSPRGRRDQEGEKAAASRTFPSMSLQGAPPLGTSMEREFVTSVVKQHQAQQQQQQQHTIPMPLPSGAAAESQAYFKDLEA